MNIYYATEIFMAVIFVALIISNQIDNHIKDKADFLINQIFICCLLKIISNLITFLLEGKPELEVLDTIMTTFEFGFGVPIFALFLLYISELEKEKEIFSQKIKSILFVYTGLILILDVVSIPFPLVYSCANGSFSTGPLFNLYQYLFLFVLIILIIILIIKRKEFERSRFLSAILYISMPLLGCVFQDMVDPMIDIVNMSLTLSAIILYITIHIQRGKLLVEKDKEMTEMGVSVMLSQIQPHFMYNALNSIQYLCRTDPEKADETIECFSKYLRSNMDSLTQKTPVLFEQEIKHLNNYLAIERIRFHDIKFEFEFLCTDFKLPALSIQPMVENAIKHGVRQLEKGGIIKIKSYEDEKFYYVVVTDNGGGFDTTKIKEDDGRSHIGISNTRSRLKSMCNGTLNIESSPGKGAKVIIALPKEENK